mmetsp:Transcript_8824/g.13146  ORF Transcript_8824/g.13146 Transcript_8824/m.13146 type:complete len:109 (+) Transcript_8824:283-609(+)
MEEAHRNRKQTEILSPQPRRLSLPPRKTNPFFFSPQEAAEIDQEITRILSRHSMPNLPFVDSSVHQTPSYTLPKRPIVNPVVFDEKFLGMNNSFSTDEPSSPVLPGVN